MLKGKLTTIRPLEPEDLEDLYSWYNNQEYSYWISGNWPLAYMLRKEDVERLYYDEDPYRFAILDQNENLIGTVGFDQVNTPARSARIFIGIGVKECWGNGYGQDALNIFIKYLFNQWNFNRITAETWDQNHRAIRCYQKIGFFIEGTLREAYYIDGKYHDGIALGLLRKEFKEI